MDFKKYFSESQLIEISVVKIGNQKITKSILNQLPGGSKIKYPFHFNGLKILGYVNDKEAYVIYVENEKFYKQSVQYILNLLNTPTERHQISTIEKFIIIDPEDDYNPFHRFTELSQENQKKFSAVVEKMESFVEVLKSHQIFI